MVRVAIGALIFLATLAVIMLRPFRVTEAMAAAGGATLMLLTGFLEPGDAIHELIGEWNIYGFFLGLMAISALADRAGVFDALAYYAARLAQGSALRLYIAVFLVGVLITIFLSNDATALILTPLVYALVTRLRLPALSFMFACTFIADTASFVLPVSNPINILVLNTFGGDLGTFLRYLLLPALFCIILNIVLFTWIFRHDLRLRYDAERIERATSNTGFFRAAVIVLGLIAVGYVVASALEIPLSFVALGGSVVLLVCAAIYRQLDWSQLRGEVSWSLFVFISGMFLLVRGIENLGLTIAFGHALLALAGTSQLRAVLLVTCGTALGANLINNVPMALVVTSALHAVQTPAGTPTGLIYATILGADLGPNLTTVGSLATILWLLILRRKGLEISTVQYFKLGIAVVPVMLFVGSILIVLRL